MCTVTFIPYRDRVFITHNRDEKKLRSRAVEPKLYTIKGQKLLFPRDGHAGGTWIGLTERGQAAVLLNGGFVKHVHQPPYRKSRGIMLLDILVSEDLFRGYENADLEGIEPFTVILYNDGELRECRWDGKLKHITELDIRQSHTWSSATLYEPEVLNKRED
ncbi:MAG: NRDE family protein, partial [Gemmatimonadaceae bacterium]|nr:NRDE family protein [Chitinophagaceae bacterium]